MKSNKARGARINGDVQRVLSHVIQFELKDPRIGSFVSVSRCEVTNDLKEAKCYISVLGSADEGEETLKGLESAKGFIRRRLAESLNMRYTPELEFRLDRSIEYGVMMSKKIDEVLGKSSSAESDVDFEEKALDEESFDKESLDEEALSEDGSLDEIPSDDEEN